MNAVTQTIPKVHSGAQYTITRKQLFITPGWLIRAPVPVHRAFCEVVFHRLFIRLSCISVLMVFNVKQVVVFIKKKKKNVMLAIGKV